MLNFNKKKYVSFDNLSKFSGMIQKALSDKFKNVETNLNEKIDSRFKSLTAKEQGDSEVIDAREGQVSLSENLKTYVKKEEHENLDNKISNQIIEIKSDIRFNRNEISDINTWMYANKKPIQRVIDFVDAFRCEFSLGETGYIKLPEVLSGVIIQWAHHRIDGDNAKRAEIVMPYPKAYSEKHYMITGSVFSRDSVTNPKPICAYVGHNGLTHYKVRWMPVGLPQEGDIHETFVNMIAIGK